MEFSHITSSFLAKMMLACYNDDAHTVDLIFIFWQSIPDEYIQEVWFKIASFLTKRCFEVRPPVFEVWKSVRDFPADFCSSHKSPAAAAAAAA